MVESVPEVFVSPEFHILTPVQLFRRSFRYKEISVFISLLESVRQTGGTLTGGESASEGENIDSVLSLVAELLVVLCSSHQVIVANSLVLPQQVCTLVECRVE
ncbi:hypothetical protein E2C01_017572 [Portunus trituberculatus]|uniref:Uncharacterized protein n=1 Tax=Portunus trituberculatus TaxID=210409 RepID=A0A5B7DS94_PORTR|nr:hypothetical protein [Portunus trituberculatus]